MVARPAGTDIRIGQKREREFRLKRLFVRGYGDESQLDESRSLRRV